MADVIAKVISRKGTREPDKVGHEFVMGERTPLTFVHGFF
jgi:hypothetical protein